MGLSRALKILDRLKLLDLAIKMAPPNLAVVVYHNVGWQRAEFQFFEEPLSPEFLEKEILTLLQSGYIVTSLSEALHLIAKGIKKRIAAITFDDGYRGVYKYAFPILKKYRIKATVYIPAGFVARRVVPWWEQLYFIFREAVESGKIEELASDHELKLVKFPVKSVDELRPLIEHIVRYADVQDLTNLIHRISKKLGIRIPDSLYDEVMMGPDEVKEMAEYGIEIGGHGLWHVNLTYIDRNKLVEEVEESLRFVKTYNRDLETPTFAYPFGIYNETVIDLLRSRGFKAAVTMEPKVNSIPLPDYYRLGRIPPYRFGLKDLASFKYSLLKNKWLPRP